VSINVVRDIKIYLNETYNKVGIGKYCLAILYSKWSKERIRFIGIIEKQCQ
jgi:hypothetical protein